MGIGLFLLTQFACEQLHMFIFLLEILCVHMTSHKYDCLKQLIDPTITDTTHCCCLAEADNMKHHQFV